MGSFFPPVLPAKKGIMMSESGIPIGKKSKNIRPKAIVLTAEFRAE